MSEKSLEKWAEHATLGGPVFMGRVGETCLPILTCCVRRVRKSKIQLHNAVFRPSWCSLLCVSVWQDSVEG